MADPSLNFTSFSAWLDSALSVSIPANVVGFRFNLYEHEDSYQIQIVGVDRFERGNAIGESDPIFFTPEEFLFPITKLPGDEDWRRGLDEAIAYINCYLASCEKADTLRASQGVGCGFVDGDLHVLWPVA